MKRAISLLLTLLLVLALVGCGGAKTKDVDVAALAAELAEKVKFESNEMRKLSADDLTNYMEVPEGAKVAFYMGEGMTMEEIIAVQCANEKDAAALKTAMETLLANQIDSARPYKPESVPRLENPALIQKGACVVLCVTDDVDTAEQIIKGYLG
jgi:hypothetical protein